MTFHNSCQNQQPKPCCLFFSLTGASEAASASDALLELLDLDNLGGVDALEDELGDAVALLDLKVGLAVVEEKNLYLASVVGVNDTGARVDEVLGGEAGSGSNAAVCLGFPLAKIHTEPHTHQSLFV